MVHGQNLDFLVSRICWYYLDYLVSKMSLFVSRPKKKVLEGAGEFLNQWDELAYLGKGGGTKL